MNKLEKELSYYFFYQRDLVKTIKYKFAIILSIIIFLCLISEILNILFFTNKLVHVVYISVSIFSCIFLYITEYICEKVDDKLKQENDEFIETLFGKD